MAATAFLWKWTWMTAFPPWFSGGGQEVCPSGALDRQCRDVRVDCLYKRKRAARSINTYNAALPLSSAVRTGLEPATPGVTGLYSNRLNYRTILFALGEASALLLLRVQSYSTFLIRPNILMKKFSLKWFLSYFANILSFISCFSGFRKLLFLFRICCVFLRTVES